MTATYPNDLQFTFSYDTMNRLTSPYPGDNPNATVQFLDTGHFALETHLEEITAAMRHFLAKTTA